MEKIVVQATNHIPSIILDPESGEFFMKGRLISISDEQYNHFQTILAWVADYARNPAEITNFHIELEFCSSGGIKFIYQIFKILENMYLNDHQVAIYWHYESDDEDSSEKGSHFQKLLTLPFHVVLDE